MILMILAVVMGTGPDIYDPGAGSFLDSIPDSGTLFAGADSAYRAGDYQLSASLYLQGLESQPWNSGSIYNLACCYGLLERDELAAVYLRRAWKAGFNDIDHIMWDPDFDPVRGSVIFSALLDSLSAVAAAERERLGQEIDFTAEGPFRCRIKVPEDYDGSGPIPLVIGLHGLGGSPETFMDLWDVVGDYECIFAVPQAPIPYLVGSRIGYSWYAGDDSTAWVSSAKLSRDYVLKLLDRLEELYNVSRVYLFGYSQGGGLTYMVGLHAPARFAALAPFSGWLDLSVLTEDEIDAASEIPVRIVHGEQDRMVEYSSALFADSVLTADGYDVQLTTFQGEHTFDRDALKDFLDEFLGQNTRP